MPEEPTSADRQSFTELERRFGQLERENRWWRGGLIAALVLIVLMLLARGHHRHIDVTVNAPPWAWRGPCGGWGPVPYAVPQRGQPGGAPGSGPNAPAS